MRSLLVLPIVLALAPAARAAEDYLVWVRFANGTCIASDAGCFHSASSRQRRSYSTLPEEPLLRITSGGRGWVRTGGSEDGFVVVRTPRLRLPAGLRLRDDETLVEVAVEDADNGRALVEVKARTPNLAASSRITARLGFWEPAVTLPDGRALLIRVQRRPSDFSAPADPSRPNPHDIRTGHAPR